jgi:hypothetical protein
MMACMYGCMLYVVLLLSEQRERGRQQRPADWATRIATAGLLVGFAACCVLLLAWWTRARRPLDGPCWRAGSLPACLLAGWMEWMDASSQSHRQQNPGHQHTTGQDTRKAEPSEIHQQRLMEMMPSARSSKPGQAKAKPITKGKPRRRIDCCVFPATACLSCCSFAPRGKYQQ